MNLKEIVLEDMTRLILFKKKKKGKWRNLVNMFTNLRGSINGDEFPSISRKRICTTP